MPDQARHDKQKLKVFLNYDTVWKAGIQCSDYSQLTWAFQITAKNLMKNVMVQGKRLMKGLRKLQKTHACIGDVCAKGLMVGAEEIDLGLSIFEEAVKEVAR